LRLSLFLPLALNNLIDYTLLAFRTGENLWSLVGNVSLICFLLSGCKGKGICL
jgi:hypothetical protein